MCVLLKGKVVCERSTSEVETSAGRRNAMQTSGLNAECAHEMKVDAPVIPPTQ